MFSWIRKLIGSSEDDSLRALEGEPQVPQADSRGSQSKPSLPMSEPGPPERPAMRIQPRDSMRIRRDVGVQGGSGRSVAPAASSSASEEASAKKQNPYYGLRKQALTAPRQETTGIEPKGSMEAWAAIMEMAFGGATATVAAFEDGTVSIYLSSGGGFLGGSAEEKVRTAGTRFIAAADKSIPQMTMTDAFPEPRLGETIFYVRTDVGTFMAKEPKEELVRGRNVLSPLFAAAQEVITQYRLWDEARGK
jgi:hypothetical protein